MYQAGAGTSHNMNTNEVLANRAAELLGEKLGHLQAHSPQRSREHGPVDQRRLPDGDAAGDSASPSRICWRRRAGCRTRSRRKAANSRAVLKTGRTHLQDAVPITLGQEFGGYAANVAHATGDLERTASQLHELNLGATAVGTGLNAGDDFTQASDRQPGALHRPAAAPLAEPLPRHAEHGRRPRLFRRAAAAGRRGRTRSRPTFACSAWARAPASRRSSCRRCSRDRRSCPAR